MNESQNHSSVQESSTDEFLKHNSIDVKFKNGQK